MRVIQLLNRSDDKQRKQDFPAKKRFRVDPFYVKVLLLEAAIVAVFVASFTIPLRMPEWRIKYADLLSEARNKGNISVIVGFSVQDGNAQQDQIRLSRSQLLAKLAGFNVQVTSDILTVPYVILIVDDLALRYLAQLPEVTSIQRNRVHFGHL